VSPAICETILIIFFHQLATISGPDLFWPVGRSSQNTDLDVEELIRRDDV